MSKTLSIALCLAADGTLDLAATDAIYFAVRDQIKAEMDTDFNSVAVGITSFLLGNPAMKTCPTSSLVQALYDEALENGSFVHAAEMNEDGSEKAPARPFTRQEKDLARGRLETVVPEYVKSLPNQFHTGRKTGIAIHFVNGETAKDAEGNDVYAANGDTVQAFRHTAEEWAKITAPTEKEIAKRAAAEAAKVAAAATAKK